MTDCFDHALKDIDTRHRYRARAKSKRRIRDSNKDLIAHIDALQKAVANPRGDFARFRREILAEVGLLLERELR